MTFFFQAYEEDSNRPDLSEPARQSLITRHQLALVDCEDANNNTPLSEAAGGGHEDTIKMLIQRGANVNSRGRYQRVPLWRAAFGGHLQAVQVCFLDKFVNFWTMHGMVVMVFVMIAFNYWSENYHLFLTK